MFADDLVIDYLESWFLAPNISSLPMLTLMLTLNMAPEGFGCLCTPCYSIELVTLFFVDIFSELLPPLLKDRVKKLLWLLERSYLLLYPVIICGVGHRF